MQKRSRQLGSFPADWQPASYSAMPGVRVSVALHHVSRCKSLSPQVYYDAWWANRNWTSEAILGARLLMRSPPCPFCFRLCYLIKENLPFNIAEAIGWERTEKALTVTSQLFSFRKMSGVSSSEEYFF